MTLLSHDISMKPENNMVTVKSEPELIYNKQNLKMMKTRNINGIEGLGRNSVLVNHIVGNQRSVISTVKPNNRVNNNKELINNEPLRCKRKINFIPGQTYPGTQPASVARRNARERNRVKQVNNGFATLRSHIPPSVAAALTTEKSNSRSSSASKKLSKVETLKMAVEYIRSLQQMLDDHNNTLEKKVTMEQNEYESRFDLEENYYSSSPDSSSQTVASVEMMQQYPNSPDRIFPKSEPIDGDYYNKGRRIYSKSEPEVFVKSEIYRPKLESFNQDIHDTLTAEFYQARSPIKSYYVSPERSPNENYRNFDDPVSEFAAIPVKNYEDNAVSPGKAAEYRAYNRSPEGNLTTLNTVPPNQALHYTGHSFIQPRIQHRNSTSLSPTISEACPSPTPSYSSDHSSIHPSSIVSNSSGHLTSRLSRLTTNISTDPYPTQLSSPVLRSASPIIANNLTPPRTASPVTAIVTSVISGSSSPTTRSNYSGQMEYQKGSPENYENYEPVSPEDEELLDVISWWQESH